ncbi:MAG TPA: metallopeptidase TldD-related protein [Thermoanaerobaculia bacterium]|jgi:predicted Zn-dependent protease|nr:metallopeptidase TldD-related protein [Thermoanaerobaculia bacterium]
MADDGALTAPERAVATLREAVALSPADETAISWVESWRLTAATRGGAARAPLAEHVVQVRVIEAGRLGIHRTAGCDVAELSSSIRAAMALARAAPLLPDDVELTPGDASPVEGGPPLHDDALAALTAEEAQQRLRDLTMEGETARLAWSETALTVVTSRGLSRHLRATGAALEVRCGRHPGAGSAAAAARTLAGLDAPAVFARARRRDTVGETASWSAPTAVVLAAEATAALIAAFGRHGLAAAAWEEERSFGRRHRGAQTLAHGLTLVEDGSRGGGLPFPLDPAGARRRPATLVGDGVLHGPVADPLEAGRLGVPITRPTVTGDEGAPEHLFALPGGVAEDDLLAAAGDGVFVGHLDPLDCWDDCLLSARAVARGVHRIERGALAAPLPDAVWELSLPQALAAVRALGAELVAVEGGRGALGGTAAPAALLAPVGDWRPLGT